MKIIYAGVEIAASFEDGGTDALQGFEPDSTPEAPQWTDYFEADYNTPIARGNTKTTITGSIERQPGADVGTAWTERALEYDALPGMGDLVFVLGTKFIKYAASVKGPSKPLKSGGVSYGFQMTWYCGRPITGVLSADGNVPTADVDGSTIQDPGGADFTEPTSTTTPAPTPAPASPGVPVVPPHIVIVGNTATLVP